MFKRWRELVPFMRLFHDHLKWMALGTLSGLVAVASAVGLLALSGWFISAAAYAGLTVTTAQLFNFFIPPSGFDFLPSAALWRDTSSESCPMMPRSGFCKV